MLWLLCVELIPPPSSRQAGALLLVAPLGCTVSVLALALPNYNLPQSMQPQSLILTSLYLGIPHHIAMTCGTIIWYPTD